MILFLVLLATLFNAQTLLKILCIVWLLDMLGRWLTKPSHFQYPKPQDTIHTSRLKITDPDNLWRIKQNNPKL